MTATINYFLVNGNETELEEGIDSIKLTLNFKLDHVSAYYVVEEGEAKYIWVCFGGQEYPLIHEDVLEMALYEHFNPNKSDLAA